MPRREQQQRPGALGAGGTVAATTGTIKGRAGACGRGDARVAGRRAPYEAALEQ